MSPPAPSAPPRLALTLGDPAGVGPEIVVRALCDLERAERATSARQDFDVVVFGDAGVIARTARALGLSPPSRAHIESVTSLAASAVRAGEPGPASAQAQVAYLEAGLRAVLAGQADALVTAPISKAQAARAGFGFPGHTEYLAQAAGCDRFAMMMAGPRLRTTLATRHIALRDVPSAITPEALQIAVTLTAEALREDFGLPAPRVAVAGLNPHAGEAGRFGDEEGRLIEPALREARAALAARGLDATVTGPVSPDAVFNQAVTGAHDAVVALYHDQGLIPAKLLDFDHTVNVTLGLPFVRTSPDHGTAYELAGRGVARADSLRTALTLAADLAARRRRARGVSDRAAV